MKKIKVKTIYLFFIELKRAVFNKGMLLSFLISGVLVFMHCYKHLGLWMEYELPESMKEMYSNQAKTSPLNMWIIDNASPYLYYLYYVVPFLAVLPYGLNFYRECKTGNIKNMLVRMERKKYAATKYVATYISGGIAAIMPLLISMLFLLPYIPLQAPNPIISMPNATWLRSLYFEQPFLYVLAYLFIWFAVGGILAIMSLLVSAVNNNMLTVFLSPFLVMLIVLFVQLRIAVKSPKLEELKYFPFNFMMAQFSNGGTLEIGIALMVIPIIGYLGYRCLISRREVM